MKTKIRFKQMSITKLQQVPLRVYVPNPVFVGPPTREENFIIKRLLAGASITGFIPGIVKCGRRITRDTRVIISSTLQHKV